MSQAMPTALPRWDLSNVYPDLESPAYQQDLDRFREETARLQSHLDAGDQDFTAHLSGAVQAANAALLTGRTLRAYLNSFVSTDSYNTLALRKLSEFEQLHVELQKQFTRLEAWIGRSADRLDQAIAQDPVLREHEFYLREASEQSRYLMSEAEETLAAELNLSGGNLWSKLQGAVVSQLNVPFAENGEEKQVPATTLINYRSHPDADVRRRAYETEMKAWEQVRNPLAAAMNGIKGTVITLDRRRGREDALHSAIDAARLDRKTLDVMLSVMRESFPMFRRYFRAKAAHLGKEKLAWYDLFAPVGKIQTEFSYAQARDFVLRHFEAFSPDLAVFAARAFDNNWIDAGPRDGKRAGAFCMAVPGVKESRVLSNFDGSLDQVFTLAHELGHAFHNDCMFAAGRTELQRSTPMTLAETASILCETIVVNAALKEAKDRQEELAILESSLNNASQVIVDIYSRFLFEKEVFGRRAKAELSAEELCEIMEWAQRETYGDGLDERYLHKYMWTWKPHYYSTGLSFYNFPYAFGLMFGISLYAIYLERGPAFVTDYRRLLSSTGMARPADLAAGFGIDLSKPDFWERSLQVVARQVDQYEGK